MTDPDHTRPLGKRSRMLIAGGACLLVGIVLFLVGYLLYGHVPDSISQGAMTLACVACVCGVGVMLMAIGVTDEPPTSAEQTYKRSVAPAMVLYVLIMLGLAFAGDTAWPEWARALSAMLPVLPIAWVIYAIWRYVRDSDELERRIQLEAIFATCGIVAVLTFAGGMLEVMDVVTVEGGLFYVLPVMFLVYGASSWRCRRKYGVKGMC